MDLWLSTRAHVASLVGLILVTRTNLKREQYQRDRQESKVEDLLSECMAQLHAHTASDMERRNNAFQSHHQLERCRADLKLLRERTAILEDTLSNYEYQLERLEEAVYLDIIEARRQEEPKPEPPKAPSSFLNTTLPIDTGHDHAPGLRERLYTRMGDIRIYHERLSNFEFDLRDRVEERDAIRAAGQNELTSNADFFERARAQRMRLKEEHDKAHEDVREMKLLCFQQGIEFEEPDFLNPIYCTHPEGTTPSSEAAPGLPNMIEDYFSSQERTANWLAESAEPANAIGEDEEDGFGQEKRRASASSDGVWVPRPSSGQRKISRSMAPRRGPVAYNSVQCQSSSPPGSPWLEALSLESASTPLGTFRQRSETQASPRARNSFPESWIGQSTMQGAQKAHWIKHREPDHTLI
jgi:hypothetical protein